MAFWSRAKEPEYSLPQAWDALQKNNLKDGRKMLMGICRAQPNSLEALALAVIEFLRDPKDGNTATQMLVSAERIAPKSCEAQSLAAFVQSPIYARESHFFVRSAKAFAAAIKVDAQGCHGAAAFAWAALALSDIRFQCDCGRTVERIDGFFVQPVLKGVATYLHSRDPAMALGPEAFGAPQARLEASATKYAETYGRLEPAKRKAIADRMKTECLVGQALVLRSVGKMAESKAIWHAIATGEYVEWRPTGSIFLKE